MTDETPPSADLDRNDLEGALSVFFWYRDRGLVMPPDTAHVLLRLQDDDEEIVRRLTEDHEARQAR